MRCCLRATEVPQRFLTLGVVRILRIRSTGGFKSSSVDQDVASLEFKRRGGWRVGPYELSQPAKREEEGQLTLLVSDSRFQLNNGESSHGRLSLATQHWPVSHCGWVAELRPRPHHCSGSWRHCLLAHKGTLVSFDHTEWTPLAPLVTRGEVWGCGRSENWRLSNSDDAVAKKTAAEKFA